MADSALRIALPPDAQLCLHTAHAGGGPRFIVAISASPLEATLEQLAIPGQIAMVLPQEAGVAWPDRPGRLLVQEALERGGVAALVFVTLADALACRGGLETDHCRDA